MIEINGTNLTYSVTDTELRKLYYRLTYGDVVIEGESEADFYHSGTIADIPPYTEVTFYYEKFVEEDGVRIVGLSGTETARSLPNWTVSASFYPKETGCTFYLTASQVVDISFSTNSGASFAETGTSFSFHIPTSSRGEIVYYQFLAISNGQELQGSGSGFSLPSEESLNASYYELFLKAASSGSGLELIVTTALDLAATVPANTFVAGAEPFTNEQIASLQRLALKFMARHQSPNSFIKRFGLWVKYQNLDFEGDSITPLSTAQKMAFLAMALVGCYQILREEYARKIKSIIDEMNLFRFIHMTQAGDPAGEWVEFFSDIYLKMLGESLVLNPPYDISEAATF